MIKVKLLIGFTAIMISNPALAYIDPGVGSMILQGFIAAVATGMVTAGVYWQKVKSFFTKKEADDEGEENKSKSIDNEKNID